MNKAKPFDISKQVVVEAWKRVKANKGSAGIDGQTIEDFEENLKDNLYKIWNRMSSGSYFPPAVKTVEIPKKGGGQRALGIPTVSDRIAQMVVKIYFEPEVEPFFHEDSYGYRPNKSAIEAVGVARQRCWRYDWVVDLDIRKCYDTIPHDLLMRAVRKHTQCKWILLYIQRWLEAPIQQTDGTLVYRDIGIPQGSVVSPILANLFLHYAFDQWMARNYPTIPFERYADDAIVHCKSAAQARMIKRAIEKRIGECGMELHPEKTKIVYCKDDDRRGSYANEKFDFLGFTFQARRSKNRWGKHFVNFSPAVSREAATRMRQEMRRWQVHLRSDKSLEDISRMFDPVLRGWITYYGSYYKSALYPILRHFNRTLVRWVTWKYKRFRRHRRRAEYWLGRIADKEPNLFTHWRMGVKPAAGQ
jgi:RNA-directed DNA polymerase